MCKDPDIQCLPVSLDTYVGDIFSKGKKNVSLF